MLAIPGLFVSIGFTGAAKAASGPGGQVRVASRSHWIKPTIVLEHGAFADASSWSGVIQRLQAAGYTVYATPDPLQGVTYDSKTLADFLTTIHGPIVLAGNSYGGVVISNAATGDDHVIPPAELLFMAHLARARITEIKAGHLSLITDPGAVARVIIAAAKATA